VTDNPADKRKHPRISPLLIRTVFSHGFAETVHQGYVTNLSYDGAFLATSEVVPVGSTIRLHITLPWEVGRIDVEAKVVWKRTQQESTEDNPSPGLGLEFMTLETEATDKLKLYFKKFIELAARLQSTVS
jgi:Tfp pilus assembly protein PilZ